MEGKTTTTFIEQWWRYGYFWRESLHIFLEKRKREFFWLDIILHSHSLTTQLTWYRHHLHQVLQWRMMMMVRVFLAIKVKATGDCEKCRNWWCWWLEALWLWRNLSSHSNNNKYKKYLRRYKAANFSIQLYSIFWRNVGKRHIFHDDHDDDNGQNAHDDKKSKLHAWYLVASCF